MSASYPSSEQCKQLGNGVLLLRGELGERLREAEKRREQIAVLIDTT
jgi:hypothetical protein